ncbi:hypothetical protein D030_2398A, partial [Vibrio parahaemolyticus AQ3810]
MELKRFSIRCTSHTRQFLV